MKHGLKLKQKGNTVNDYEFIENLKTVLLLVGIFLVLSLSMIVW